MLKSFLREWVSENSNCKMATIAFLQWHCLNNEVYNNKLTQKSYANKT